ncbi:MAG: hypothetical protein ACFFC6_13420 [Promethearchaeota archaeon]
MTDIYFGEREQTLYTDNQLEIIQNEISIALTLILGTSLLVISIAIFFAFLLGLSTSIHLEFESFIELIFGAAFLFISFIPLSDVLKYLKFRSTKKASFRLKVRTNPTFVKDSKELIFQMNDKPFIVSLEYRDSTKLSYSANLREYYVKKPKSISVSVKEPLVLTIGSKTYQFEMNTSLQDLEKGMSLVSSLIIVIKDIIFFLENFP